MDEEYTIFANNNFINHPNMRKLFVLVNYARRIYYILHD